MKKVKFELMALEPFNVPKILFDDAEVNEMFDKAFKKLSLLGLCDHCFGLLFIEPCCEVETMRRVMES